MSGPWFRSPKGEHTNGCKDKKNENDKNRDARSRRALANLPAYVHLEFRVSVFTTLKVSFNPRHIRFYKVQRCRAGGQNQIKVCRGVTGETWDADLVIRPDCSTHKLGI